MRVILRSTAALLFLLSVGILESASQAVTADKDAETGIVSEKSNVAVQENTSHQPDAVPEEPVVGDDAMKQTVPRVFGVKTLILGVLVFLAMLYASVYVEDEPLQKRINEILGRDGEGSADYAEQAKRLGAHLINPFQGNSTTMTLLYTSSIVYILSGFSELFSSLARRSQARRGAKVSKRPPFRALGLLAVSVAALIICFLGMFFTPLMHFLTIGYLTAGFVFGASSLVGLSFFQQYLYQRRKDRAAAAKAAISPK